MLGAREPKLKPLDKDLRFWTDSIVHAVSAERLRNDVERLPAPRNRLHFAAAMDQADNIIAETFRSAGWSVEHRSFELTNVMGSLDYGAGLLPPGVIPTLYTHLAGANILAFKPGRSSTDAVVIGAHHDTIRDSPGADDNSASVAALLELARVLSPFSFEKTVVLAAIDMEEIGFFGSRQLVRELPQERKVECAIIYESMAYTTSTPGSQQIPPGVGWLYPGQMKRIKARNFTGDWTFVLYRKSAAALARYFAEGLAYASSPEIPILMRDPSDIRGVGRALKRIAPNTQSFARSDHYSFWEQGIPAIMITDTANFRNPNYHEETDTPDTLDYDRLAAIVSATAVAIARIATLKQ